MTVTVTEVLALPREERERLLEALMETSVPPDIGPLVRELVTRLERITRVLDAALERMSHLEARIERARAEAREAVLRSGEVWPFRLPDSQNPA